jgi:hypothetical protein
MTTLTRPALAVAALAMAALPSVTLGQLHGSDIAARVESGRIITGRIDGGTPLFPHQVFTSVLGLYGIPAATFDPGFDSQTGAFPSSTPVGITVRRALRLWDGEGFSIIPPARLEITRSTMIITPAADPLACAPGPHLEIGLTTAAGRLHLHPAYLLHDGAGGPPAPGIYLLEIHAWLGVPGQGTSEPIYILFSHDEALTALEAAAVWAGQNLARPCYANCDRSTTTPVLNVDDFTCFINAFASGDCYANCDGSTTAPILNVDDFTCFLNQFAQGCP